MTVQDVSIIIPTYNRPKFLEMVLQTYFVQKYVKELIIVDDGSNEDYSQCLKAYEKHNDIKLIYQKLDSNHGQAYCRNYGIKLASGKYIMMGEDDVFLEDNYVEVLRKKIIEAKKQDKDIFICGNIFYQVPFEHTKSEKQKLIKDYQSNTKDLFDYKHFFGAFDQLVSKDTSIPFGHALIMVEKSAYNKVEYYENYLANSFREESDGQIQLRQNGYAGFITSDTYCYHLPGELTHKPPAFKDWIKYNINFMKSNSIFWKRNYKYLKQNYNYKYPKIYPCITHDYRAIKDVIKKMLFK